MEACGNWWETDCIPDIEDSRLGHHYNYTFIVHATVTTPLFVMVSTIKIIISLLNCR